MKLSELDPISKIELKNKILNHKLKYKDNVDLNENMRFGIEIEVISPTFIDIMKTKKGTLYYEMPEDKPSNVYDFDKWVLTHDESLKDDGGEISSPIFTDNPKTWQEIKRLLNYITKHDKNAYIDERCASQIHFDADVFDKNAEILFAFMVMLAENEQVLTRFFNGEYINLRKSADIYATSFTKIFLENITYDIRNYLEVLEAICVGEKIDPKFKKYAFDFSNMYLCETYNMYYNTFENRIPNGTLNPTIIQNNIMTTGHLLKAASKYDFEKGLYNIRQRDRNEPIIDDEQAFCVADYIENDDLKLDFLKQYYKDGATTKTRKLKKSLEFI